MEATGRAPPSSVQTSRGCDVARACTHTHPPHLKSSASGRLRIKRARVLGKRLGRQCSAGMPRELFKYALPDRLVAVLTSCALGCQIKK